MVQPIKPQSAQKSVEMEMTLASMAVKMEILLVEMGVQLLVELNLVLHVQEVAPLPLTLVQQFAEIHTHLELNSVMMAIL